MERHSRPAAKHTGPEAGVPGAAAGGPTFRAHCTLHEFFVPFQHELDALLKQYGLPPMRWDTARKGDRTCPNDFRHWPPHVATAIGMR